MTQLALNTAPAKRFSEGPYATTTAQFDDSGDWSATAWQGPVHRGPEPKNRAGAVQRQRARSAASTDLIVFVLPAEPSAAAPGPVADVIAGNVGLVSTGVDSADVIAGNVGLVSTGVDSVGASIPEEGVYAPPRPRKVLLSEVVEFRTDQLPRRKPRITSDDSFLAVIDDE